MIVAQMIRSGDTVLVVLGSSALVGVQRLATSTSIRIPHCTLCRSVSGRMI